MKYPVCIGSTPIPPAINYNKKGENVMGKSDLLNIVDTIRSELTELEEAVDEDTTGIDNYMDEFDEDKHGEIFLKQNNIDGNIIELYDEADSFLASIPSEKLDYLVGNDVDTSICKKLNDMNSNSSFIRVRFAAKIIE